MHWLVHGVTIVILAQPEDVGTPKLPKQPACEAAIRSQEVASTVRSRVTDEFVLEKVDHVEQLILEIDDPIKLPRRDRYAAELEGILRSVHRDALYEKRSLRAIPKGPPGRTLQWNTVARVIRCLGKLQAEQATWILAEFLDSPSDLTIIAPLPPEAVPAMWALIEIGDPALPVLRQKMISVDRLIAASAASTAREILGPRASDELEEWIQQAKTPEQRERLAKHRDVFRVATANLRGKSFEEYRLDRLEQGRRTIQQLARAGAAPHRLQPP